MRDLCKWVLVTSLALWSGVLHADPVDDLVRESRSLAGQRKFDEALSLLSRQPAATQQELRVKLVKARILAWSGRLDESRACLDGITEPDRSSADVLLLDADLHFYQGQPDRAAKVYEAILDQAPDYLDAKEGLARARAAMQTDKAPVVAQRDAPSAPASTPHWQVASGFEYSDFDQAGRAPWRQTSVQLDHLFQNASVYGRVARYDQYRLLDADVELGGAVTLTPVLQVHGFVGGSQQPEFRPTQRVGMGGEWWFHGRPEAVGSVALTVESRYDEYADDTRVRTFNPGVAWAPYAGVKLSANLIGVDKAGAKWLHGRAFRVDVTPSDQISVYGGYADAPENELASVVRTRSWFVGMAADLAPGYTARLGYARDDRENAYIRQVINVGIAYRF
ncbi:MAG: YaiO family outer membrane beta-barrel protein [Aquabacterium sp.]|jgi:YaiO family outer membrane protein|nr:YaiO family outer membrane beta-barrel protein [Aquabacterium sp.]MBP8190261.1 YaiO family outer membrane beta-barrel protein [Aquabacterium sp.]